MIIRCPECHFERNIDLSKIPPTATRATCPKCRHKFHFRSPAEQPRPVSPPPVPASAVGDSAHHGTHGTPPSQPAMPQTASRGADMAPATATVPPYAADASFTDEGHAAPFAARASHDEAMAHPVAPVEHGHEDDTPYAAHAHAPHAGHDHDAAIPRGDALPDATAGPSHALTSSAPHDTPHDTPHGAHRAVSPHDEDDPLPPGAITPGGVVPGGVVSGEDAPAFAHYQSPQQAAPRPGTPPKADLWDAVSAVGEKWKHHVEHATAASADGATGATPAPEGTGTDAIPWEQPTRYGLLQGLYQTILRVLFNAPHFFENIRSGATLGRPMLFFLILGLFQAGVERSWASLALRFFGPAYGDPQIYALIGGVSHEMSLPMALLTMPFLLMLQLIILSGLYHMMLRFVQPEKCDFHTTYRVVAYSAAPTVVCLVPLIGPVIGSVWFLASSFMGCKYALRLPWFRTAVALGPLFILGLAVRLMMVKLFVQMGAV